MVWQQAHDPFGDLSASAPLSRINEAQGTDPRDPLEEHGA